MISNDSLVLTQYYWVHLKNTHKIGNLANFRQFRTFIFGHGKYLVTSSFTTKHKQAAKISLDGLIKLSVVYSSSTIWAGYQSLKKKKHYKCIHDYSNLPNKNDIFIARCDFALAIFHVCFTSQLQFQFHLIKCGHSKRKIALARFRILCCIMISCDFGCL